MTALLSCFLATSAVLIASASGSAAVDYPAATTCPDAYGPVFSRSGIAVDKAPAVVQTIQRQAAAHGFAQALRRGTPAPCCPRHSGSPRS